MADSNEAEDSRATTGWSDDSRADKYDRPSNQAFYQSALAALLDGAPTLAGQGVDLGCGTGFATEVLVARYPNVAWQGIDASEAMLTVARKKPGLTAVTFRQGLAEALPLGDQSVDVVVANFSWHWFNENAGTEVRRVLRPGGWVLATVPLRLFSGASGNRVLARALLADRHQYSHTSSQGFRFEAARALLPGPVRVGRHDLRIGHESFPNAQAMLDVLDSRGALRAIFGDHPPVTLPGDLPLDFTWPFALVHLQVLG